LIHGGVVNDVGHQHRQKLSHSIDSCGECSIGGIAARGLTSFACSFYPLAGYGVYDVEYAKLVGAWGLLEVGVDLLDQDGFIL
jgi:hypothetical protein